MRSLIGARRLGCVLALLVAAPSLADSAEKKRKRSVADCTSFQQRDRDDEDGVDLAIANACTIPVSCSVSWALVCAPDSKKRRSRSVDSAAFTLDADQHRAASAMASRCGDDGWAIDDIVWSCQPSRD